jgi:predicted transcriptional regulator
MKVSGRIFEPLSKSTHGETDHIGHRLREIRKLAGFTQAEVAERLRIGQSAVTRLESRKDIHVSTLRDYLGAMGATLRIHAQFDDTANLVSGIQETDYQFDAADENQLSLPIFEEDDLPRHRDVVFSIKPEYSRKIVSGEKTIELRRRFPMSVPSGTTALIYETSPTRALAGIAEIGQIHKQSPSEIWKSYGRRACIGRSAFDSYFAGADSAFAIELKYARPLRRPIELRELRARFSFEPPQSFLYATPKMRDALLHERAAISD